MAFRFRSLSSKVPRAARTGLLRISWSPAARPGASHGREEHREFAVRARFTVPGRGRCRPAGILEPTDAAFPSNAVQPGSAGTAGRPVGDAATALVLALRRRPRRQPVLADAAHDGRPRP